MTALAAASPRAWSARFRIPAWAVTAVVCVIAVVLVLLVTGPTDTRALDPDNPDPPGARAAATLLRARGTAVARAPGVGAALSAARPGDTLFVAQPDRFTDDELRRVASTPAALVVAGADPAELAALGVPARVTGTVDLQTREPRCALPAARVAGGAQTGGFTYRAVAAATAACYPAGQGATLLAIPRVTLLGSAAFVSNARLARDGNAALALALLGSGNRLVWMVPGRAVTMAAPGQQRGLLSLLPARVEWVVATLGLAIVLLALARLRRLGPVVDEPLPVAVPATEVVLGRARLYAAGRGRPTAAEALRAVARRDLALAMRLPSSAAPRTLCAAVADRLVVAPEAVDRLLYGPSPGSDAALLHLADDLDTLRERVTRG